MAFYNVPTIVAYRVSWISYMIVKNLITIPYVSLPNIMLNEEVIPEFLQKNCTAKNILQEAKKLLENQIYCYKQQKSFESIRKMLYIDKKPSLVAAKKVLEIIDVKQDI